MLLLHNIEYDFRDKPGLVGWMQWSKLQASLVSVNQWRLPWRLRRMQCDIFDLTERRVSLSQRRRIRLISTWAEYRILDRCRYDDYVCFNGVRSFYSEERDTWYVTCSAKLCLCIVPHNVCLRTSLADDNLLKLVSCGILAKQPNK